MTQNEPPPTEKTIPLLLKRRAQGDPGTVGVRLALAMPNSVMVEHVNFFMPHVEARKIAGQLRAQRLHQPQNREWLTLKVQEQGGWYDFTFDPMTVVYLLVGGTPDVPQE